MNASSPEETHAVTPRPAFARWLGTTNDVTRRFLAAGRIPGLINIAGGLPAPELYPAAEVAELARRVIEQHPQDTLGYGPIEGLPELRDALAARFATPELRLGRENVLVTTSGMQGLDLIGKALLEEGGLIAGQFPARSMLGARAAPLTATSSWRSPASTRSRRWRGRSSSTPSPISPIPRVGLSACRCAKRSSRPPTAPASG